ncbi:MAG: hypothetical protein OHK0012_16810 [Synechococcales cyanobacterium]
MPIHQTYLDIARHQQPILTELVDPEAQEIRIGRHASNTIPLENAPEVSRFHALLLRTPLNGYEIVDLNSKSGTRLNGVRITAGIGHHVEPGDTIGIGFYDFSLREEAVAEPLDDLDLTSYAADVSDTQTVFLDALTDPILWISTASQNQNYALTHSPMVIGRSPDCDIVINDPLVSSRHACLQRKGLGWEIEDLDSTNGVYFQGQPIKRKPLSDGDTFQIAQLVTLTYRDTNSPNLVPAAHSTVIKSLRNGVVVLDRTHLVIDLNPAAEVILKKTLAQSRGRGVQWLLADHPKLLDYYMGYCGQTSQDSAPTVFGSGVDVGARFLDANISPLVEENGELAGHVMMLHDMTRQHQAAQELRQAKDVTEELYRALRKEIDTGKRIQREFLPQPDEMPQHPEWELSTVFRPARDIAGDFYDLFPLPGDCIGLVIGDVSDKGVGSSLFMALFRSLIRVFAEQSVLMDLRVLTESMDPVRDPEFNERFYELTFESPLKAVGKTHEYMFRNHGTACMFATLFFGVLDPASGRIRYINAGHESPIIVKQGEILARLPSTGVAVGFPILEPFIVSEIQLKPGEQLVAYTDGITDAKDNQGHRFTEARLLDIVQRSAGMSVTELLQRIEEEILEHIGSASPFDDITMLGVEYLG